MKEEILISQIKKITDRIVLPKIKNYVEKIDVIIFDEERPSDERPSIAFNVHLTPLGYGQKSWSLFDVISTLIYQGCEYILTDIFIINLSFAYNGFLIINTDFGLYDKVSASKISRELEG